jgi:hypothetical protein
METITPTRYTAYPNDLGEGGRWGAISTPHPKKPRQMFSNRHKNSLFLGGKLIRIRKESFSLLFTIIIAVIMKVIL